MQSRYDSRYMDFLRHGFKEHGQKFTPPQGEDFITAFNHGQDFRIKVVTKVNDRELWSRWGYVSVTTGWKPCFLLMKQSGQRGSSDVLNPEFDKVVDGRWLAVKKRRTL